MYRRLEDISKDLGVSSATISRALNKNTEHLVKKETRETILSYVKETGYKPNLKARGLAKGKLTNLFLIQSEQDESIFYDLYYSDLINGINNVIADSDYSLVILPIKNYYTEDQIYDILFNQETAGLFISPFCLNLDFPFGLIKDFEFPVIALDSEIEGDNVYSIMLNHFEAGYKAAERLSKKKDRDIVFISDSMQNLHSQMRRSGFYSFFERHNIGVEITEFEFPLSYISGGPVLEKILSLGKLPISVFVLSDEIGVNLINQIWKKGLRCPEDIAVLGFDGLSIRNYTVPCLSSIGFNYYEVGKIAAKVLINTLSGKKERKKICIDAKVLEGLSI